MDDYQRALSEINDLLLQEMPEVFIIDGLCLDQTDAVLSPFGRDRCREEVVCLRDRINAPIGRKRYAAALADLRQTLKRLERMYPLASDADLPQEFLWARKWLQSLTAKTIELIRSDNQIRGRLVERA